MGKDPIVEEVRKIRQQHAKRFNYDLRAIVDDLRKLQEQSGRKYIRFEMFPGAGAVDGTSEGAMIAGLDAYPA